MEKTMRLLTCLELSRCTVSELWDLYRQARHAASALASGSPGQVNAQLNIRRIRTFLARMRAPRLGL
jgi:hypothetical protein